MIKYTRKFSMPNFQTFKMKPVKELLERYIKKNDIWLDPFANNAKYGTYTNDINHETTADHHLHYHDFLYKFTIEHHITGILLDPPYSSRQIAEHYKIIGRKWDGTEQWYGSIWKKHILRLYPEYVIQFGWHTNGNVKNYKIIEILQLNHGRQHNDTLVSCWIPKEEINIKEKRLIGTNEENLND